MKDLQTEMHESVVARFERGWRQPHPHAWDDLFSPDVELTGPLLAAGRGIEIWHGEVARLLGFLADARGEVIGWAARGDTVFIELAVFGTAGGADVAFTAVDRLIVGADGLVVRRETFMDPSPLTATLLRRPRAWWPWWRSGLGPLLGRRRILSGAGAR